LPTKSRFAALAAATLLLVLAALAAATKASAWAWGCAFGNPNNGPPTYCVYVSGGGNWVNSVTGNWGGGTQIQNWYITAEFFDTGWHWYQTINGPYHSGCCATSGGNVIYINSWKYTGYVCSTLHYQAIVSGYWQNRAMSACFRINW